MVKNVISMDQLKALWHSEVHNEQRWAANMKLVRALGVFAGGVFLMRSYGDLMAIAREIAESILRNGHFQSYLALGGPAWLHQRILTEVASISS
ncbi:hypothetical protein Bca4012_046698 [Brassica carinata]